jgi:hypothetical protein
MKSRRQNYRKRHTKRKTKKQLCQKSKRKSKRKFKKNQKGGGIHEDILNINTKENKVDIIIGAHHEEPHVIEYATNNPDVIVICISQASVGDNAGSPRSMENKDNRFLFKMDFNDVALWQNELSKIQHVRSIIVDWSTAKFFKEEYNMLIGKIFEIIKTFITKGAVFYSHCCTKGKITLLDFEFGDRVPKSDIDPKFVYGKTHVEWKANTFLPYVKQDEEDITIARYIKKIKYYLEEEGFIVESIEVQTEAHNTYPLKNNQQQQSYHQKAINSGEDNKQYPFSYIVIRKKV